jgi:hypothetical protein
MTVPVTADQVATLRAYLTGDFEEYERLYAQLDRDAVRKTYLALIEAACFEAIDRRFARNGTVSDVIEFVGDVRSRSERVGETLDPRVAEQLIRAVLGDGSIDNLDDKVRFGTEIILLAALIADEQLDDAGLDEFIAEARRLADRWTE